MIKKYPQLMKELFVCKEQTITAGICIILVFVLITNMFSLYLHVHIDAIKELLHVRFEAEGSNARQEEIQTWVNFGDFLDECEGIVKY